MKKRNEKLAFVRETLIALSNKDLDGANGGTLGLTRPPTVPVSSPQQSCFACSR